MDDRDDYPDNLNIGDWKFTSKVHHILNSKCTSSFICEPSRKRYCPDYHPDAPDTPRKTAEEVSNLKSEIMPARDLCNFCKYNLILEMAHMPDMTYPENGLRLEHSSGFSIDFNVLDALAPVIVKCIGLPQGMKVGSSEAWLKSRTNSAYVSKVHNAAFDWTFTTDYPGTIPETMQSCIQESQERIDFEKLTQRDKIVWFKDIDLFEDELADHGTAGCSVKIRVMEGCFFILLRYFLRIDNVFVRFYDTRYYHEFGKDFIIRERTINESNIGDLRLTDEQLYLLVTPHELYNAVPQTNLIVEKIILPLPEKA